MKHLHMTSLQKIHEDVPADHYDKGIESNIFQKYWHKKRFAEVLDIVKENTGPILDVGCHAGLFTQKLMQKTQVKEVYGIDISSSAIRLAKKRIPKGTFVVGDAQKLPFKNNFFSAVFCLEMLEHVDDPIQVLKEMKRVLKKDGYGLILVPTDNKLFKITWSLWTMYYPVWRHAHVQSFTGNSLEDIFASLHLKIIRVKTFHFGMLKIIQFKKDA